MSTCRLPVALLLAAACLAGCGSRASLPSGAFGARHAPGVSAAPADELAGSGEALFATLDSDGDGHLSRLEAGLPAFDFDRLDRNGDGALGFLEWSENGGDASYAAQAWQTQLRSEAQRDLSTGSQIRGLE